MQVEREASHRSYQRLLESGVRIFNYQQTKTDAKVIKAHQVQRAATR